MIGEWTLIEQLIVEARETRDKAIAINLLVKLKLFAGCSMEEAAETSDISLATAYRRWAFVRAWLLSRIQTDV